MPKSGTTAARVPLWFNGSKAMFVAMLVCGFTDSSNLEGHDTVSA